MNDNKRDKMTSVPIKLKGLMSADHDIFNRQCKSWLKEIVSCELKLGRSLTNDEKRVVIDFHRKQPVAPTRRFKR